MTELEMVLASLLAVSLFVNVVLVLRADGRIPPELGAILIDFAREQAKRTPATWDDTAVAILEATNSPANNQRTATDETA